MKYNIDELERIFNSSRNLFIGGNDFFNNIKQSIDNSSNFPPYNIEKCDDNIYKIVLAVAGFEKDDINISQDKNILTIKSDTNNSALEVDDDLNVEIIYRGIAKRSFVRKFSLDNNVKVTGAKLEHGLLTITLEKIIPEEDKSKMIEIK